MRVNRTSFRSIAAVWAAIALLGCAGSKTSDSTSQAPAPSDGSQVAAPALHSGDVWIDRIRGDNREFRIEAAHDNGTMDVSFWGSEMQTDPNLNVIVYRSLTAEASDPTVSSKPGLWFAFPMYPGKTWTNDYTWKTEGAFPTTGSAEDRGRVVGWEEVTVPAGSFHALKVEVISRFFGKGGMADESTLTYWWVPPINRFVKFDYHSNFEGTLVAELVQYKPEKKGE